MKRIMLAAGPWIKQGTDCATRVVLYEAPHKHGELVVHVESYNGGNDIGRQIEFVHGSYFPVAAMKEAVECWDKRNTEHVGEHPSVAASYEMASAANAADLSQKYCHGGCINATGFNEVWKQQEKLGKCDGFGGAEYRRKFSQWYEAGALESNILEIITR